MANKPEDEPEQNPPIMIVSLMKLAWGLTLNLSADEPQQKAGEMVNERFGKLLETTALSNKGKLYINEIMACLSAFLRNMGYEKDFLVKELDINEDIRNEEIKSINDLADLTSLSNEGLISRIVAFLFGGASIFPLIEHFFGLNDDTEASLEIVEKTVETATKTGETTITETLVPNAPQEFAVPDEILIFLVGGGIGIFVLTIVIKLVKSWWIKNRILSKTIQDQQSHWKKHVRREFIRLMLSLFYDIIGITKRYYPACNEPILEAKEDDVKGFIDDLLPIEELYVHTGSPSVFSRSRKDRLSSDQQIT